VKDVPEITVFMERASKDPRLGPLHVSLYFAIVLCWLRQGAEGPAKVSRKDLMQIAKISGRSPMFDSLRELHEYGYIEYHRSFDSRKKNRVYLPLMETMGYRCRG